MKILVGVVCLLIGGWCGMWMGFDMGVRDTNKCVTLLLFNESSISLHDLEQKLYACAWANDIATLQDLQSKGI